MHGLFKIRRGSNECGIESTPAAGTPDLKAALLVQRLGDVLYLGSIPPIQRQKMKVCKFYKLFSILNMFHVVPLVTSQHPGLRGDRSKLYKVFGVQPLM